MSIFSIKFNNMYIVSIYIILIDIIIIMKEMNSK
jgi:hypothetical protein